MQSALWRFRHTGGMESSRTVKRVYEGGLKEVVQWVDSEKRRIDSVNDYLKKKKDLDVWKGRIMVHNRNE